MFFFAKTSSKSLSYIMTMNSVMIKYTHKCWQTCILLKLGGCFLNFNFKTSAHFINSCFKKCLNIMPLIN